MKVFAVGWLTLTSRDGHQTLKPETETFTSRDETFVGHETWPRHWNRPTHYNDWRCQPETNVLFGLTLRLLIWLILLMCLAHFGRK